MKHRDQYTVHPERMLRASTGACIGFPAAEKLVVHIEMGRELASVEDVIDNPLGAEIPVKSGAEFMQMERMYAHINADNAAMIIAYIKRFREELQCLFINMVLNKLNKPNGRYTEKDKALVALPEFNELSRKNHFKGAQEVKKGKATTANKRPLKPSELRHIVAQLI